MQVTIASGGDQALVLPISFFFWAYVAAYVVHILEESMVGETFVGMVRRISWPGYQWRHFFWFNTLLMGLIVLSIVVFELVGGGWILLPLTFVFQMVTNGFWHLAGTAVMRRYSPGLLTSILYWLLFYFVFRYAFLKGQIAVSQFAIAATLGTLITVAMIGSFLVFRKRFAPASV